MTWLEKLLTNRWMAAPDFDAQMAHLFAACSIVLAAQLYGVPLVPLVIVGVLAAGIKEYWYDLNFEIPKQTVAGSTLDFVMYCVGMVLGLLLVWGRVR